MAINCKIYTPPSVVKELLLLCGYNGNRIIKKHVVDNSCGQGAILEQVLEAYIFNSQKENSTSNEIQKDIETYIHGFDTDEDAIHICKENLQRIASKFGLGKIDWDIRLINYLDYQDEINYDYIIGNPPYISYYDMEKKERHELKRFESCNFGKYDYYYAFIEKAFKTLKNDATMTYIVPNSFLKNCSGKRLRELIKPFITDIIDLSGLKIFNDVLVSTCIVKIVKKTSDYLNYTIKFRGINEKLPKKDIEDKYQLYINEKYECKKFGDYYNVFSSVATLLNKAFLLDKTNSNKIDFKEKVIRKAASPKVLLKDKEQYIIFPYTYDTNGNLIRYDENEFKNQFPTAYNYLLGYKEDLEKTDKDQNVNFYEYGRSQALKRLNQEKLLVSTLVTKEVKVYLLDKNTIPYSGLIVTAKNDNYSLEFAKNILESNKFLEYVENVAVSASGVTKRISAKDVEEFYIGDIK